ncbi:hypothetical protein BH10ACT9_BH10ACT9_50980 [soil metagenome]
MAIAPFDQITATYTGAHSWMYETVVAPAVYRTRHAMDTHFLTLLPQGAHILDVGCGGGLLTGYVVEQRPDLHITAIDLADPQLERATKRLASHADRVTFQRGDATALDFPDATFDGVLSYGSIKHWTSRQLGLAECVRVLKPGGPLLVTDADRSATFDDSAEFVRNYKFPRIFDTIQLAVFRTWIAGRSIDLDEGRELAAGVPDLVDVEVARVPDSPIMMIAGRRAPSAAVTE